jgi:hypothetical protein
MLVKEVNAIYVSHTRGRRKDKGRNVCRNLCRPTKSVIKALQLKYEKKAGILIDGVYYYCTGTQAQLTHGISVTQKMLGI